MKFSELKRFLEKQGCHKSDEGGRHEEWYNPKTDKYTRIGRHKSQEISKGTLNAILKDLGFK